MFLFSFLIAAPLHSYSFWLRPESKTCCQTLSRSFTHELTQFADSHSPRFAIGSGWLYVLLFFRPNSWMPSYCSVFNFQLASTWTLLLLAAQGYGITVLLSLVCLLSFFSLWWGYVLNPIYTSPTMWNVSECQINGVIVESSTSTAPKLNSSDFDQNISSSTRWKKSSRQAAYTRRKKFHFVRIPL